MFPWPVRLLGICLAAVELLMLALNAFGWHFSVPGFEDFLRWLGDSFSSFFAPIETLIRGVLAMFEFHLPKLAPHWHHLFVLMWLLLGSVARMRARAGRVDPAPLSPLWLRKHTVDLAFLIWAFVCALIAAVAVGTQPIDSFAVLIWPVSVLIIFISSLGLPDILSERGSWIMFATAVAAAVGGYVFTDPVEHWFGNHSPGLFFWLLFVGFVGLIFGLGGLLLGGRTLAERLMTPFTAFGLDIVGAYAIAFALAYIFGGGITQG